MYITAIITASTIFIVSLIAFLLLHTIRKKWYEWIPITGIFLAAFISHYPFADETTAVSKIAACIVDSIMIFFLNVDYGGTASQLIGLTPAWLTLGYEILFAVLYIAAPICTAVVIVSFISDYVTYARLKLPSFKKRYIFSSLNEKTYALASSIKAVKHRGQFIFCGLGRNERETNEYYEKAKRQGFYIIERPILATSSSVTRQTNYFVISENGSENLDIALKLLDKYHNRKKIKIFVTSNETEAEYLLDKKYDDYKKKNQEIKSALCHINEPNKMAYELLYDNPLYLAVTDDWKQVSMLVVGAGYVGLEVLKNAVWCSTSDSYSFDATVIDTDIARSKGLFQRACPAVDMDAYHIRFHETPIDAETSDLLDFVSAENGKFNYIVIATGDDEINIKAALDLRSWYLRAGYPAHIAVVIRDEEKYELLQTISKEHDTSLVTIFPFGCSIRMYSYDKILNSEIERYGVAVNAVYSMVDDAWREPAPKQFYQDSLSSWRKLIVQKKRSSMASAIFMRYVLWMRGYEIQTEEGLEYQMSEGELEQYARLEHRRWNAYQLTEGYYPWAYEEYSHSDECNREEPQSRNDMKRLHMCITDFDTLGKIGNELGKDYLIYDYRIVNHIPNIISGFSGLLHYEHGIRKKP